MPKLTINDVEIDVPAGYTVLQAAQMVDTEIPVFCYHPRLPIAGNCRMCLVEMENSPKPIASCAMPVNEGMIIRTNTEKVKKARQGVLELLLINHPLDCPICDQGGECDLQDITVAYGPSSTRFDDNKRAVPDKYMGPIIKTSMTRCIHCTRCVRFATDIAGVPEMGAVGRGENTEITTYLDHAISSELSGNLVDVCPVGALTSKPYQFQGRPWELGKTESIDVLDAVGSNIRLFTYGLKVKRILPRLHEDINEEWISDKTRYACDGLSTQRLDTPYLRQGGKLGPCTWDQAFEAIKNQLTKTSPKETAALVGDLADCESIKALKDLMDATGVDNRDCRLDGQQVSTDVRASYLFNTTIAGIEQSDFCLIIGANVRSDAAMVHARLRKRYLMGGFKAAYLGGEMPTDRDFTFAYENLGTNPAILDEIISGKHAISKDLKAAKNPMIIIGRSALTRKDGQGLMHKAYEISDKYKLVRDDWNGFNVLHHAASRVGALDLDFVPTKKGLDTHGILDACTKGTIKTLYLLGADAIDFSKFHKDTFIIYQGHHGDAGAHHASVILPGAAYTEKDATYVNMEGRPQQSYLALDPPGEAKEDWKILRALSEVLGHTLPYNTLEELRAHMVKANKIFKNLNQITPSPWKAFGQDAKMSSDKFKAESFDFYMADVISKYSKTMARCAQELSLHNHDNPKDVANG